jgi:hypothetical protein
MKQIVIGNRDIVCSIGNSENSIRMRIIKLPTPCYGQNRGARNYHNQIEVLHDIYMDICENNLKALQRAYEAIQPYKEICIDGVAFLIKPNQKGIETMKEWFKDVIEIVENELKGENE